MTAQGSDKAGRLCPPCNGTGRIEHSASDSKQSPDSASLPCPNCGKDLGVNARTGKPLCPYCGYSLPKSADLLEILERLNPFNISYNDFVRLKPEIAAALQTVMLDDQLALLKDLSDCGEIHHSVYDYRYEQLLSLKLGGQ